MGKKSPKTKPRLIRRAKSKTSFAKKLKTSSRNLSLSKSKTSSGSSDKSLESLALEKSKINSSISSSLGPVSSPGIRKATVKGVKSNQLKSLPSKGSVRSKSLTDLSGLPRSKSSGKSKESLKKKSSEKKMAALEKQQNNSDDKSIETKKSEGKVHQSKENKSVTKKESAMSFSFMPSETSAFASIIHEPHRIRPPALGEDLCERRRVFELRYTGFFQSVFNEMKDLYIIFKKIEVEIENLAEQGQKLKRQSAKLYALGQSGHVFIKLGKGFLLRKVKVWEKKDEVENRLLAVHDRKDNLSEELVEHSRKIDRIHYKVRQGIDRVKRTYLSESSRFDM